MTYYPIPSKAEKPNLAVLKKKEARKKLLEKIRKKRAEIIRRMYKR
jgi:hypothetical protein